MQIMITWRQTEGKSASVQKLISTLKKLRPPQNQIIDELQKFSITPGMLHL